MEKEGFWEALRTVKREQRGEQNSKRRELAAKAQAIIKLYLAIKVWSIESV